ncbi:MAG TPA: hypothetical protein VM243_04870 [Phycisphaerae bacterium]|nr:hypothetical protein [Phycisphaerae bacterium]
MRSRLILLTTVLILGLAAEASFAHRPIISRGSAVDAEHALSISNVQVSRVVYHRVTDGTAQLWITFDVERSQRLAVQLGVPFIGRLREYRPSLAVLGPGLPEVELPFEVPEGLGGLLFQTEDVDKPQVFDEPFSTTRSWILEDTTVELPEGGTYYVVAFHPDGENGKLWVATGREEDFSLADIVELPGMLSEVRTFHEVAMGLGIPCILLPFGALTATCLIVAGKRRARL